MARQRVRLTEYLMASMTEVKMVDPKVCLTEYLMASMTEVKMADQMVRLTEDRMASMTANPKEQSIKMEALMA